MTFPWARFSNRLRSSLAFCQQAGRPSEQSGLKDKDEFDFSSEEEVESFELVGSQLVEDDSADEEFKEAADGLELAPFGTYVVSIVGRSEKEDTTSHG